MFRFLLRFLNVLSALTIGLLLVDEVLRRAQVQELDLTEDEFFVLNDLIKQHGEGFAVYYNKDLSGMAAFPPPFQGLIALVENG